MNVTPDYGPAVQRLLTDLSRAGYPPQFVRDALPEWWNADAEVEPAALVELKILLARRLGLDLKKLLEENIVELELPAAVKYKRAKRLDDPGVNRPFFAYCSALARSIAAAMPEPSRAPSHDPADERAAILADPKVRWVSLNAVLQRCWEELGIAVVDVVHALNIPKGFDAASYRIDGRYVILLVKDVPYAAWASFIVAHELGHIAAGHVRENQVMLDDALPPGSSDAPDEEEYAANQYGVGLLSGMDAGSIHVRGRVTAPALLEAAKAEGAKRRIDPGHIILRYAREFGRWDIAQAALRGLDRKRDVARVVNAPASHFLALADLGSDARESVLQALGEAAA